MSDEDKVNEESAEVPEYQRGPSRVHQDSGIAHDCRCHCLFFLFGRAVRRLAKQPDPSVQVVDSVYGAVNPNHLGAR